MNTCMRKFILLIFVSTFLPNIAIAVPPPETLLPETSWKPTLKEKAINRFQMGPLKIELEKTNLKTILETLGRGKIDHQGDASASIYWLCYTIESENSSHSERLWIISHGEMGGEEHAVTEIKAVQLQRAQATSECPNIPAAYQQLSFNNGLWLGISEHDAMKFLGPSSYENELWRYYEYQGKVPGNCQPDGFDLTNWLRFKTDHGLIVAIEAGQVTSC